MPINWKQVGEQLKSRRVDLGVRHVSQCDEEHQARIAYLELYDIAPIKEVLDPFQQRIINMAEMQKDGNYDITPASWKALTSDIRDAIQKERRYKIIARALNSDFSDLMGEEEWSRWYDDTIPDGANADQIIDMLVKKIQEIEKI